MRGSGREGEPSVVQGRGSQCRTPVALPAAPVEVMIVMPRRVEPDLAQVSSIVTCVVFTGRVPHYSRYYMDVKGQLLPQGTLCLLCVGPHLCTS